MPRYIQLYIGNGNGPQSTLLDYVRNGQDQQIIFESVETGSDAARRVVSNLWPEIASTRLSGVNYPNLSQLGEERMHGSNLPAGLAYFGTYFPAVGVFCTRGQTVDFSPLTYDPGNGSTCAHCAYQNAISMLRDIPSPENIAIVPSVIFVGPQCNPAAPGRDWNSVFDEHGRICLMNPEVTVSKLAFQAQGCGNCGFPGHTKATCTRTRFYSKVGVEIEGRFFDRSDVEDSVESNGLTYNHDSSISDRSTAGAEPLEIQTKAGTVVEQLRQLAQFYPDETDKTCGMHIHVSFLDNGSVSSICSPEFYAYFLARWRVWGETSGLAPQSEFFCRLNGENDFCEQNTESDFLNPYNADRYRQLNFKAWDEHKTVECRMLPMFKEARLAYSALVELVSIYEDWLGTVCPDTLHTTEVVQNDPGSDEYTSHDVGELEYATDEYSDAQEGAIVVIDLPPVTEGHRRICTTPYSRSDISRLFAGEGRGY